MTFARETDTLNLNKLLAHGAPQAVQPSDAQFNVQLPNFKIIAGLDLSSISAIGPVEKSSD